MTCHPASNTPGATFGAGTVNSSEAHDFDPVFLLVLMLLKTGLILLKRHFSKKKIKFI